MQGEADTPRLRYSCPVVPRPPVARLMFTGLVETVGRIVAVLSEPPGVRLVVDAPAIGGDARLGDSICVSGCCLSVVAANAHRLEFQLGEETLARTALGALEAGAGVNLERSLRLADRLGGHLVTGHVDGVGRLVSRVDAGEWSTCRFAAPTRLLAQMAEKGSIAVSGVSLTVVDVATADFGVALIPHTLGATTLGALAVGDRVNLETDVIFKYVARFLEARDLCAAAGRA